MLITAEMDPLDPRFLAQAVAPSVVAVHQGSAAHALRHSEDPIQMGNTSTFMSAAKSCFAADFVLTCGPFAY
jgi:hypothetical protein